MSLRRTGLRLLGGLVRGASSAASEKAYDAHSAGELKTFGGRLEAVNAVVLPKCAAGLVCVDALAMKSVAQPDAAADPRQPGARLLLPTVLPLRA